MATFISDGSETITPLQVLGYRSSRTGKNHVHPVIGKASANVTLHGAGLRSGTLEMLVQTLGDALALEAMHAQPATFTLADDDLPGLNMTYVLNGDVAVELDDETRDRWLVSVDYLEVAL